MLLRFGFAVVAALAVAGVAVAQEAPPKGQQKRGSGDASAANTGETARPPTRQLPADQVTSHTVELPGRTLKFTALAGSIPLLAADGKILAEMAYVSYQLDGGDAVKRPVTFSFNGGPGSASAWVHLGGFGPWRLPIDGAAVAPSALPVLLPNAETWLDFTDLVFIDPVGTGYSRMAAPAEGGANSGGVGSANSGGSRAQGGARFFYSVDGDAASVAEMMAKWLRKQGRLASPKFLAGESYGGIRGPKVASILQSQFGVGLNALVLISPVMDYGTFRGARHQTPMFINTLPTIAAAAREAQGKPVTSRAEQKAVEDYARGEYLSDLMRGPRDAAALDRLVKKVAVLSNLSEPVVRAYGGKLDEFIYLREANRLAGKTASGYDATVRGDDADPTAYFPAFQDPFGSALAAPLKGAMLGLYTKLNIKTELEYNLSSGEVNGSWNWGGGNRLAESFTQLRASMALDPRLRVLVTHGYTDLRTPYFASQLLLEQLPAFADGRVELKVYPGGHMHYSREGSRIALRNDVKALIDAAVAADPARAP